MILLIHKNEEVIEIVDLQINLPINNTIKSPIKALFKVAKNHENRILVWCHQSQKEYLSIEGVKSSFQLKNTMVSYSKNQYLPAQIGYVEDSPFLKVNKSVKYPTWLMNSDVGAIYASQLLKFEDLVYVKESFDFVLNVIAKFGMPNGLFCYSEPSLLIENSINLVKKEASNSQLFKFIKQHYKGVWSVLLLLNFIIYERKFPFISFIKTLFIKRRKCSFNFDLEPLNKPSIKDVTIDVIIPTLGRRDFLHDVLLDLKEQTLLPEQVIIIEQNEVKNSKSELDFISNNTWPFKIIHKFIHQTGACNARNLALKEVTSDYVFFADDDIRVETNYVQAAINKMENYQFEAVTLSCLQKKDVKKNSSLIIFQLIGPINTLLPLLFICLIIFDGVFNRLNNIKFKKQH